MSALRNRDTVPEALIAIPKRMSCLRTDSTSSIACSKAGFCDRVLPESVELKLDWSDHEAKGSSSAVSWLMRVDDPDLYSTVLLVRPCVPRDSSWPNVMQSRANALRADRRPSTTVRTAGWGIRRSSRQARDFDEAPTPASQRLKSMRRFSAHSLTISRSTEVHSFRVRRNSFVASEIALCPSPDIIPSMSEVKNQQVESAIQPVEIK